MGIVNGNPMGMGISMVRKWEWEWEWEWLYGNGREWESERHSRTPLVQTGRSLARDVADVILYPSSCRCVCIVILCYEWSA